MAGKSINAFNKERKELNTTVMEYSGLSMKRFFSLDSQVYRKGKLSEKTKELIGLVSSLVLRCDDCIKYHTIQCYEKGITDNELEEAISIGLIVGGSITIPHIRKIFKLWKELKRNAKL
ncbi:MAG: carboxymuconolactone decarboxylase family protein [bacterium]